MYKIAITGPESSGKTSLTLALANHLNCPFTEEYARNYLELRNGEYTQKDLLQILIGQIKLEEKEILKDKPHLICDTDPLVIWIWSKVKFGQVDDEIDEAWKKRKYNLYLLVKPDIPWVRDPLRESKNERDDLFLLYKTKLEDSNRKYIIIDGNKTERLEKALNAIQLLEN